MPRTFDYVKYDDESIKKQEAFKAKFEELEQMANELLEHSRPRSLFFTGLEESYMWIGKAIRDEQIKRNAQTEHQPGRSDA
jgi:hypothetical protein